MANELAADITLHMSEWNPPERTPPAQPGLTPPLQPEQATAEMPTVDVEPTPDPMEPGRQGRWRRLRRSAPLLAAAAIGGGIAAGVVVALDDDGGGTTTVVQERDTTPESTLTPVSGEVGEAPTPTTAELDVSTSNDVLTPQAIYERYAPGVVQVRTLSAATALENLPDAFGQQPRGLGSGFVIDKEGHIITNYHVVEDADTVQVVFSDDLNPVDAKVLGRDPSTDIAVLQVDTGGRALTPIPLGDSDSVIPGDTAIAIGNPFGLDRTITEGIVSAIQRSIRAPDGFSIENVIQTDAAINSGNSGGPLLNNRGEVIGVNSQIIAGGGISEGNVGIGFAVPVNTVRNVGSQIIETGKVEHAYLGVRIHTISEELTENVTLPVDEGVLVANVTDGSPAAEGGLRGGERDVIVNGNNYTVGGDVVTHVDGELITDSQELVDFVASKRPGDEIILDVSRDDGSTETLTIELGRRPPAGG